MSDEIQFKDEESLGAWLKTRPRADSVIVAHRAAMRGAPIWSAAVVAEWARKRDLTAVPLLRLNLISGVAAKMPTPEIRFAAARAADAAGLAAVDAALAAARGATLAAAHAAHAAHAAAEAADNAADADDPARAAHAAARAAHAAARATDEVWTSIESDARALTSNEALDELPLWPFGNPLQEAWTASIPILRDTPGGDFWIDWYQCALDGRPQNWPLLEQIALIDPKIWDEGGEALAAEIRRVRRDRAVAATANGEDVAPNPETGRLRLVPASPLPDDIATYARRKIVKATQIFDDVAGQAYGGLTSDLAMLRRAASDAANLPLELFDACSSAALRLSVRIDTGDCPSVEQDPLIADYRQQLREVGADILGADPETSKVLERRAAISGNDALIENRDQVLELTAAVGPLLEGRLACTLPLDAETATDPHALPQDRAAASFRLAGRLLRIERSLPFAKDVCTGFAAGNTGLVGVATYLQTMDFFATSPVVRSAMAAIFRYLGL